MGEFNVCNTCGGADECRPGCSCAGCAGAELVRLRNVLDHASRDTIANDPRVKAIRDERDEARVGQREAVAWVVAWLRDRAGGLAVLRSLDATYGAKALVSAADDLEREGVRRG